MSNNDYNGWANYETWNVNLWIQNDEGFYNGVVESLRDMLDAREHDWQNVTHHDIRAVVEDVIGRKTPDGVSISDHEIDWDEISDSLLELAEGNNIQVRPELEDAESE